MNIDHHDPLLQPKWSAGLCQCGDDPGTCFITCCLPCITFGQIAEVLDEGQTSHITQGCVYVLLASSNCHWLFSCFYREKLRSTFGLPGNRCSDCCVHFCCEPCALCQEHAELKHRGLDPSKYCLIGPPNAPPQFPPSMNR